MSTRSSVTQSHASRTVLSGKRIVVTRGRSQAGELTRRLEGLGAEIIEFPTISIQPPSDYAGMDCAIEQIESFDWLFFTSVNGVGYFFNRLRHLQKDPAIINNIGVVAIGPETARALRSERIEPSKIPTRYQAEGILEDLDPAEICGKRILIPRAAQAREVLPETLRRWGATVDVVSAYQTVLPDTDARPLRALLSGGQVDLITFTSSSTVSHFLRLFEKENLLQLLNGCKIACIGPITGNTVIASGLRPDVIAREFTTAGLVDAIIEYYKDLPTNFPENDS
jgi:uroporphyrinogen III methyltransferase / synthase